MAIVTFVLVGLGVALIIIGCFISIADWNRRHRPAPEGGLVTEGTSAAETLDGLAKLADALKGHPLGMQLILVGVLLLVIAGIYGGISQM